MKVITSNNIVLLLLEDSISLEVQEDRVVYDKDGMSFEHRSLDSSDVQLFEYVDVPSDVECVKSTYDGSVWGTNPDWIPPRPEPEVPGKYIFQDNTWVQVPEWTPNPE